MSTTDRRARLVDTAIDLIATRGIRALTHRALDAELALPPGSASYYFRTKKALVDAISERVTIRSREDFLASELMRAIDIDTSTRSDSAIIDRGTADVRAGTGRIDPDSVAHAVARWLDRLLAERRNHLIARHALIVESIGDADSRDRLARSLFSVDRARDLFLALEIADPDRSAGDFVAMIEGAVFDRLAGVRAGMRAGTDESVAQLTALLSTFLRGAAHDR
ncbi:TetR/AcrR family transcriptional regulator [Nocardia noduli]|uniref:TetR/AcrR family transcriptional regulator n=1 Tax=Nocardia noduli TaxID=2815722 RepID=UPI001C23821A|nr:TetR family transcriptional regulator [Nocardia noduli]